MRAFLHPDRDDVALVDAASGRSLTHAELAARCEAVAARLAGEKAVVLVRAALTPETVVAYLGALASGHAVLVVDEALPAQLAGELEERYRPRFVLGPGGAVEERDVPAGDPLPHPDLALLLSTSGTTGSPKLVRLSAANLEANAHSIVEYLGIRDDDRAIASLPLHYCFGLSVLHTHLLAGGSVVLPGATLTQPAFWDAFAAHGCTSFAGVPHAYKLLRTTGWDRRELPALRTMTQAGGRLAPDVVRALAADLRARGARFVVMYGQTEATARMAYLPPDRVEEKPDSIGVPVPRGRLDVDPESGELVFTGPNVMLGYATERAELAAGDVNRGVLRTGDLGRRDDDGFFYVTGRLKRFAKLFGLRVSLDDVERALPAPGAAVERDDRAVRVWVEEADPAEVRAALAQRFGLPPRSFDVRAVDRLPLTSAGKVDYAALRDAA